MHGSRRIYGAGSGRGALGRLQSRRQAGRYFPQERGADSVRFPHEAGSDSGGDIRVAHVLYPFGHGLSYTDFKYSDMKLSSDTIPSDGSVTVSVNVTNTGKRRGDEVVQLYMRDDVSSVITYEKVLRGFERVSLEPGETRRGVPPRTVGICPA